MSEINGREYIKGMREIVDFQVKLCCNRAESFHSFWVEFETLARSHRYTGLPRVQHQTLPTEAHMDLGMA